MVAHLLDSYKLKSERCEVSCERRVFVSMYEPRRTVERRTGRQGASETKKDDKADKTRSKTEAPPHGTQTLVRFKIV